MLGCLFLDIICSSKLTIFLELRSRKTIGTDNLHGKISKHNFTPNGRFLFNILRNTCSFKIGDITWLFPGLSRGIITHVTRLYQSRKLKYLMDYNYTYSSGHGSCIPQSKAQMEPLSWASNPFPSIPLPLPRSGFSFIGALLYRRFPSFLQFLGT